VPLSAFIEGVEGRRAGARLVVFNHTGPARRLAALREHFGQRGVPVEHRDTDRGPENFAVLYDGSRSVAADSVEAVHADVTRTPGLPGPTGADGGPDPRSPVAAACLTTTLASRSRAELTRVSQHIERHAADHGGELRAGFQRLSNARPQWARYRRLPGAGVDAHVYGRPDWRPPGVEGTLVAGRSVPAYTGDGVVTVHAAADEEVRRSWFVAYDGPADPTALVAEQRGRDRFFGFWTTDGSLVADVLAHLRSRSALAPG
jgi:hypothetical protein